MKCVILILLVTFLFQSGLASCQSFTLSGNVAENTYRYGFSHHDTVDKIRFHASRETMTGFGITGGGIIIGGIGLVIYDVNSGVNSAHNNALVKTGAGMWLVGGIVGILGSVLAIDGGMRDVRWYNYKEQKLSLYSSGKNELGIAYNF